MRFPRRIKRAVRRKTVAPAKRRIKREIRRRPLFTCGGCGKKYSSPFGHRCTNKGDFGKRKREAARAAAAAARKAKRDAQRQRQNERVARARRTERHRANRRVRAEREKSRQRVKAARAKARPPRRPGRPAHDYRNCRDHDCERQACEAYREGLADAEEQP